MTMMKNKTEPRRYQPDCTRLEHALWALKTLAMFVVPCIVLATSGVLLAKHLAPTQVTLHASDEP
jgi:hypothetical protein